MKPDEKGNNPSPADKPKKKLYQKWWFWVLAIVVIVAIASPKNSDTDDKGNSSDSPTQNTEQQSPQDNSDSAPTTQAYSADLSSGNYTAGVDFPAGTYNITAVSGGGNVSSDNAFSGGINAIMGVADKNNIGTDMYEQEYKNISLPDGVTLTLSGVTVNISSDAASADPLTPRNQDITEAVELGSGNFVAGKDFPAGVYDISAVSGGGNVSSDNVYSGGINAIMGTADKNNIGTDMYEQEYKNINLQDGTTLTISGVSIKLTPSK